MTTPVYFDLDGVLRNLNKSVYGYEPRGWNEKTIEGLDLLEVINQDLSILEYAPIMKYYKVVNDLFPVVKIATCQLPHWITRTNKWIKRRLPNAEVLMFNRGQEKFDYVINEKGGVLVEDSPFFEDYSNVILIDHPYNRHVDAPMRVKTAKQLENILYELGLVQ